MSRKYIELILFSLFAISYINTVSGLNIEGVRSGNTGKSKAPSDDENTDKFFRRWSKKDAKKSKGEGSSSAALNETEESLSLEKQMEISDALDNVPQNLIIKDSTNYCAVCKEWRNAASRKMSNTGVEGAVLPHIFSAEVEDINRNFHATHVLRSKPHVALLFVSPSRKERTCPEPENLEYEVLDLYRRHFPQYLVTLGVDQTMLDDETITSCSSPLEAPNGILGLFVPLHSSLDIKVSRCTIPNYFEINMCADEIMHGLMPIHSSRNTVLIMFATTEFGIYVSELVLSKVKQRYTQKKYTLWGGAVTNVLKTINSRTENRFERTSETFFAMSITGSNLKSWSILIDCTLPRGDVDQQLFEFKNNIEINHNTIGLVYGPQYIQDFYRMPIPHAYEDNLEIMETLKRIFPEIPFESVFNYIDHNSFGVNSIIEDNNQELSGEMKLSIMILSHD